jgi:hypothetical protein
MPLGKDIRSIYMYLFNKLPYRGSPLEMLVAITSLGSGQLPIVSFRVP